MNLSFGFIIAKEWVAQRGILMRLKYKNIAVLRKEAM